MRPVLTELRNAITMRPTSRNALTGSNVGALATAGEMSTAGDRYQDCHRDPSEHATVGV